MLAASGHLLRQLAQSASSSSNGILSSARSFSSLGSFTFSSVSDAPVSSLSSSISVAVKSSGKAVDVSVTAGRASAKAKYDVSSLRKLAAHPLTLYEVPRVSVLHSSILDYLVKLANERYNILASWPDFTTAYGKDFYFRAHPEDLKKFYAAVDEFHRIYDVITEFESLNGLASELLPAYLDKRMSTLHPVVGPHIADGVVTQFLLSH